MAKNKTQDRWNDAVEKAQNAIQELISIQDECQGEYDDMTEKKQEGEKGEALQTICDVALGDALEILNEAEGLEIP